MRILMGHKFHRPGGGVDKYFLELCAMMEARGHEVVRFAMHDPENLPSDDAEYFAPQVHYGGGPLQRLRGMAHFVYSPVARSQMARLVRERRPQLAHFQHVYHQLTTSVFGPLRDAGIPIVQGIHDYKLGCPRYMLFDTRRNELCDRCQGRHYYHALLRRCYDGSILRSALIAVEAYYNKWFRTYERAVDRFVVPSAQMKHRLVRYGIAATRVAVVPNFVEIPPAPADEDEGYFLSFGRLSIEKGIEHLLLAMRNLPGQRLLIVGDGPDADRLRGIAASLQLRNVEFLGSRWGDDLQRLVARARVVVVPSYWHENSPMVIYESFAAGKTVVASRRGGIPELVEHGVDGILFEPGDVEDLTQCLRSLADDPERARALGRQARRKAENEFTPEVHYERLRVVYRAVGVEI